MTVRMKAMNQNNNAKRSFLNRRLSSSRCGCVLPGKIENWLFIPLVYGRSRGLVYPKTTDVAEKLN